MKQPRRLRPFKAHRIRSAAICRWGAQHRGLKPPDVGLVVATKGWFGWSQPGTWSDPDADTKWRHRRRRGQPFEIERSWRPGRGPDHGPCACSHPVSSDASLNHSLNQYHIAAARRVTFRTLRAGVSANRAIPKALAHVAASQNGYLSGLLGRNGASQMADRQSG